MSQLVDVRCPLPSKRSSNEKCNKLCVRVQPGSSGKAYCSRHDAEFEFQVDDSRSFSSDVTFSDDTVYPQPLPDSLIEQGIDWTSDSIEAPDGASRSLPEPNDM